MRPSRYASVGLDETSGIELTFPILSPPPPPPLSPSPLLPAASSQDTDVPAGDIGVGGREVGFLFGAYKQMRNEWVGVLTGKGYDFGGSKIRPEATGYGCVYYAEEMIRHARGEDFKGKRVLISGAGNVAQFAALKVIELGGVVCSLSDSKGALVATGDAGLSADFINDVAELKLKGGYLKDLSAPKGFKYEEGARPWKLVSKVDVALPSATQNELDKDDAEALVAAGCGFVAEGANMPSTLEAIEVFEASRKDKGAKGVWYGPGKAANCGGVAVYGLEMAQNSARLQWTEEEVDQKLKDIMTNAFNQCLETAQEFAAEGELPSLVSGGASSSPSPSLFASLPSHAPFRRSQPMSPASSRSSTLPPRRATSGSKRARSSRRKGTLGRRPRRSRSRGVFQRDERALSLLSFPPSLSA